MAWNLMTGSDNENVWNYIIMNIIYNKQNCKE